jgi:L-asparagine transporter-like permease
MKKNQKYSISLALITGILIIGLKALQNKLAAPEIIFYWVVGACLFFCIYEWIAITIIETKRKTVSPRQSINLFMGLKIGKIVLSLFFVMVYALTVKTELTRFVVVFVILYLIFLVFDTVYLAGREKSMKSNGN